MKEYGELSATYVGDVIARNQIALCASQLRDLRRAQEEMRQAVELLPNSALFRINLALYANYAGDFRSGEQHARRVQQHFADRAELMVALARHLDAELGLPAEIQRIADATSGAEQVVAMVSLQARTNPSLWAVARAVDAVRRTDPAADRAWQDRLDARLAGCRHIAARLESEGNLEAWTRRARLTSCGRSPRCERGRTLSLGGAGPLRSISGM